MSRSKELDQDAAWAEEEGASFQGSAPHASQDQLALRDSILEGAHDGIFSFRADGVLLYANPAMHWIFGAATSELEGIGVRELQIPGLTTTEEIEALVIQTARRQRWKTLSGTARRFTGDAFPIEVTVASDVTADAPSFVGIVRDMTDQVEVLDRLRVSEEQYHKLFDTAPMAIVTWRPELTAIEWNETAGRLFGWRNRRAGKSDKSEASPFAMTSVTADAASIDSMRDAIRKAVVDRTDTMLDVQCLDWRREERRCRWYLAPLVGENGRVWAMITVIVDLSHEDRAAKKLDSLRRQLARIEEGERSRIARELHDDLSQRLAAVALGMQLQEAGVARQGDQALAESIAGLRLDLESVASDMHTISRQLHPTVLDDLGLVAALRSECARRERLAEVKISFEGRLQGPEPRGEVGIALFRVLQESLGNAIRHSGASRILVAIYEEGPFLELTVEDHGSGFRTKPCQSEGGPSGIGLASMRERMQLVGGELRISTLLGTGTVIRARVAAAEPRKEPGESIISAPKSALESAQTIL